jgi:two-component system phosphate regulon sensor histidine kinase PhoR
LNWWSAAARILSLVAAACLLGWYLGHPLKAVSLALLGLVLFWLAQLWRMQKWLEEPEQPPPDIFGLWGDLLARIYHNQRKNRETRQELQSTIQYLRDSLAAMRDGVIMVDDSGNIEWFNESAGPLLGLRFPEDRGQALTNLVRAPQFNEYFIAGDYQNPLRYHAQGETPRHLQVEITRFGEGERLLFVRDITDAVRTDQIRRDFVGNVSHELRTPLTVITGYLGTFLSDPDVLPKPYQKALQQMIQQATRMENLLKDLLWLSRIESEEREEKRDQVNVPALLEELREEVSATHPEREITLRLDTDRGLYGNYRELYSAVSNLVRNAIKYSPDESPVGVHWCEAEGTLRLSVCDRGMGIDRVHIPRLTERFYRVDDSRSSATGGTGLGLAIVKHVAASNKAELKIESELGKGSIFTLVFPMEAGQDEVAADDNCAAALRALDRTVD